MTSTPATAQILETSAISHAGIGVVRHPEYNVDMHSQTVVRYLRFGQHVHVHRLELKPVRSSRWIPCVPTHPAHVLVSIPDEAAGGWRVVRDIDLPAVGCFSGEGLRQDMPIEEMERVIAASLDVTHQIDLGDLWTDVLRVECDREHPVWPSHGECNGVPFSVPFATLDSLVALGEPPAQPAALPCNCPSLRQGPICPQAPSGITVELLPWMVLFRGARLSVGFSLRRPQLMHLGWDGTESGRSNQNRLHVGIRRVAGLFGGQSGPVVRTFRGDFGANVWTGAVAVEGNQVRYWDLDCGQGLLIDATFTVTAETIEVHLTQRTQRAMPVIEAEAWRLSFDCAATMTAAAAVPTLGNGRNGEVELPMLWAGDGNGCLQCEKLDGDGYLQIESYRCANLVVGGMVLGDRGGDGSLWLPAGTRTSRWRWSATALRPETGDDAPLPAAIREHWGSVYSCFRPELGGFSNNAVSCNCHVNQHSPTEIVALTRRPERGPDPLALHRFTVERALLGGGGYGYWRNLYLDSDPILVSAAGRLYQARPDEQWLAKIGPGLLGATRRMLATIGEEGLALCRDLSGNSGSFRWSSNAMDVVGCGHMDAYVNAWTYRGLRNAASLLRGLQEGSLADACTNAAGRLRRAFADQLVNPRTGWVAGWRSRDGLLHDAGYLWVNGVACAFGLLDPGAATEALQRLEALRQEGAAAGAHFGLPFNLLPIPADDHMLPRIYGRFAPTFENYTDGAMAPTFSMYYIRALDIYGLGEQAGQVVADLELGYRRGHFSGGIGSGVEFYRWDGTPSGYEGTFVNSWPPLYAIAVHRGLVQPASPEWWPD